MSPSDVRTFRDIHVSSPGTVLRAGEAWQNIIKQKKSALQVYISCVTLNNQGQDTPSFVPSVLVQPLLGTRPEHPDPEFLQRGIHALKQKEQTRNFTKVFLH